LDSNRRTDRSLSVVLYAEIAVAASNVRGDRSFHYSVPNELTDRVHPGQLVTVEFGNRLMYGIVLNIATSSPVESTKPVLDIISDAILIDAGRLELARWVARNYGAPLGLLIETMLPPRLAKYIKHYYAVDPSSAHKESLSIVEQGVLEKLTVFGPTAYETIEKEMGRDCAKSLSRLVSTGVVRRWTELETPEIGSQFVRLVSSPGELEDDLRQLKRAPKQVELLRALSRYAVDVPVKELLAECRASRSSLTALVDRGLVTVTRQFKLPHGITKEDHPLQDPDPDAWNSVETFLDRDGHAVSLLLGADDDRLSVYVSAIEKVLAGGGKVLVIAPTEHESESLFKSIAGNVSGYVVLMSNSSTVSTKLGVWRSIRSGEVDVVVGPAYAVYAPMTRLALVIIDREEDRSYKERRGARAHLRQVGIHAARVRRAPVILGSETPSIETFDNVEKERYRLILMSSAGQLRRARMRVGRGWGAHGPAGVVDLVDMRVAPLMGHGGVLSEELFHALQVSMQQKGSAVLFVNRRGAASLTVCRDCGFSFECPDCSTYLVHHSRSSSLVCHTCNHRKSLPKNCPECHSTRLRFWGYGTEAVANSLKVLFPNVRIGRLDSDVAPEVASTVAESFKIGAIQLLVGTSYMFRFASKLSSDLLGIVQADVGIGFPDYTAPERVFQSLMRLRRIVLGGQIDGRMVIQTLFPDHPVMLATSSGSYLKYFRSEIQSRIAHDFPPASRMVRFLYSNKDGEKARKEAYRLAENLRSASRMSNKGFRILGPAPCFISRERRLYRWHLVVSGDADEVCSLLQIPHRGWVIDVDPVDLL